MVNPISFIKRKATFFMAGFIDQHLRILSQKNVNWGKHIASKMHDCEPWSDHISYPLLDSIHDAIMKRDFQSARGLIAIGATDTADPYCIKLAEKCVDLLALGAEVTMDVSFLE